MTVLTRGEGLDLFESFWLPKTPLAGTDLSLGLHRTHRKQAVNYRYVETQPSALKNMMVFDVDSEDAASSIKSLAWDDETIPEPNLIVENPGSSHAHAYYFLKGRVSAGTKAHDYYAHIYGRLAVAIGSDPCFTGKIARTPHQHYVEALRSDEYTLLELDIATPALRASKSVLETGEGRNVDLFNNARMFAYRNARRLDYDYNKIYGAVLERALELNAELFADNEKSILGLNEVKGVARSVAKWVSDKFTEEAFSKLQATRSHRRWEATSEERRERGELMLFMKDEGLTAREIAEVFGTTPGAVRVAISRLKKQAESLNMGNSREL